MRQLYLSELIATIISCLFILLFTYAGVSKLIDFQNFRIQLGQSPLVSSFATEISILVPLIELLIIITLSVKYLRLFGLFASYMLMVLFTAYIFILLHYSPYIPCSCGGILEKMTWNQHLVFNLFFIFLAGAGIVIMPSGNAHFKRSGYAS